MSSPDYEQGANVLRVFLEDNRAGELRNEDDLYNVLSEAIFQKYVSRGMPASDAQWLAGDDAAMIERHLDLIRPALESWWKNG